jgi:hypothetical protein
MSTTKCLFLLILIFRIQNSFQILRQNKEFDGILNENVLFEWGFTSQRTEINLTSKNIKLIENKTFRNFTKLKRRQIYWPVLY